MHEKPWQLNWKETGQDPAQAEGHTTWAAPSCQQDPSGGGSFPQRGWLHKTRGMDRSGEISRLRRGTSMSIGEGVLTWLLPLPST